MAELYHNGTFEEAVVAVKNTWFPQSAAEPVGEVPAAARVIVDVTELFCAFWSAARLAAAVMEYVFEAIALKGV